MQLKKASEITEYFQLLKDFLFRAMLLVLINCIIWLKDYTVGSISP